MKLINSSFEIIPQEPGLIGAYKQIEIAGRTCYKSEDKIEEGSAKKMVDFLTKRGHGSPLEHGTIYLKMFVGCGGGPYECYQQNQYSKVKLYDGYAYITTNARVLMENDWTEDLKYICEPTKYHEKRVTVKFICDRGVSHEAVRHRVNSFCQESTRYCNYMKEKFGMSVTFIQPDWIKKEDQEEFEKDVKLFEDIYFKWLNKGYVAQQARYFLPTGVKTELVITGFVSDWKHFFELRCSQAAHPDIRVLAIPLEKEFKKQKLI